MIYNIETFNQHIDLSKLVSISNAYFIDKMGCGGYFVRFNLHFQLMDNPIILTRELDRDKEMKWDGNNYLVADENGNFVKYNPKVKTLAELILQKEIDAIIDIWILSCMRDKK